MGRARRTTRARRYLTSAFLLLSLVLAANRGESIGPDGCELTLSELPGAEGVARDGSVVFGRSGNVGVFWRRDEGFATAHIIDQVSVVTGSSDDGQVLIGTDLDPPRRAVRWTAASGAQSLHDPAWNGSRAEDVSRDGEVIVGTAEGVERFDDRCRGQISEFKAVVWTGGSPALVADPAASPVPFANHGSYPAPADPDFFSDFEMAGRRVSGDGSLATGVVDEARRFILDEDLPLGSALRCSAAQTFDASFLGSGADRIDGTPFDEGCSVGLLSSSAIVDDVSDDGEVLVGRALERLGEGCDARTVAMRFGRGGGGSELSPLPGYANASASLVSPDGRAIHGTSNTRLDPELPSSQPTLWREDRPEPLRDVLAREYGVELDFSFGVRDMTDLRECGVLVLSASAGNPNVIVLPCRDRDADGLCDLWEEDGGIDLNDDGEIDAASDLLLDGADPDHKDIYVEVDVVQGAQLEPGVLDAVMRAFSRVPNNLIGNPNGRPGISLHLELDDVGIDIPGGDWTFAAPPHCGQMPDQLEAVRASWFGSAFERVDPDIVAAKKRVYRYLILGSSVLGASGKADWSGNDILVSGRHLLGSFEQRPEVVALAQQGTIMHELGHTLQLLHGGPRLEQRFKPNHHSVMNYTWQYPYALGLPGLGRAAYALSWRLDYARTPFNDLDETALDERAGIGGHPGHEVPVGPVEERRAVAEAGPVDFDLKDGATGMVQANVNDVRESQPQPEEEYLVSLPEWSFVAGVLRETFDHPNWEDGVRSCDGIPEGSLAGIDLEEVDLAMVESLAAPLPIDCNGNGIDDALDLIGGIDVDVDGNGLLDGCQPLPGDGDGDGDVDLADRDLLVMAFGLSEGEPGYRYEADLDSDQLVSLVDYQLWVESYDAFLAAPLAASPPPASGCGLLGPEALAPLALLRILRRRRRKWTAG